MRPQDVDENSRRLQCLCFSPLFKDFLKATSTRAQIVTLTTFVWLFSNAFEIAHCNVRFQMCPQLWPASRKKLISVTFLVGVHNKMQVLRPISMH